MILRYDDGHLESVGQVRMDRKISPEMCVPLQLYIEVSEHSGRRYAAQISTCNVGQPDWVNIPQQGTLVWCFSALGDWVSVYDEETDERR
ncbi:hypothetical protein BDW69DRAFT_136771 [Aspergillus filifer]